MVDERSVTPSVILSYPETRVGPILMVGITFYGCN